MDMNPVDVAMMDIPIPALPGDPTDDLDDDDDNNLPLQRYNAQLPASYRHTLATEKVLLMRAMHVMLRAIQDAPEATEGVPPRVFGRLPKGTRVAEGYEHEFERDFAVLEKGVSRIMDLKHAFEEPDYALVVNVLMRGVLTEGLDMGLRSKLARCCVNVLQKRQCVLPDGVPWRPVMAVLVRHHIDCMTGGVYVGKDLRDAHCRNVVSLLRVLKYYKPPGEGMEQLWEDFLPRIGDHVEVDERFQQVLLMTQVMSSRGDDWSGWVPQAMDMWASIESSSDWDSIWMSQVAALVRNQPCNHEWDQYLPLVYSRLTRSFRLPLGAIAPQSAVDRRCPHYCSFLFDCKMVHPAAAFIIFSLSPKSVLGWQFLDRMFALIANYFHPSNTGRWSRVLGSFLAHVVTSFAARIRDERAATKAGVLTRVVSSKTQAGVAAAEHRLTEDNVTHLVDMLLPLVQSALQSKLSSVSLQAAGAARDLAIVAPDKVITPFLMQASEGLESVSSPHRTSAALRLLTALSAVFLDTDFYAEGTTCLSQIMALTLPGIDPNDLAKTEATFKFMGATAARLQSIVAADPRGGVAVFLEEYVHLLLERVFTLLESLEAPAKKNRNGTFQGGPEFSYTLYSVAMENLFGALPGELAISVAHRISRQVCGAACLNAIKYYAVLVRCSGYAVEAARQGSVASIFLTPLVDQVLEHGGLGETASENLRLATVGDDQIVWRIRMLAQACRASGSELLKYMNKLQAIVDLAMTRPMRSVYKAGGRLLRGVLEGLTAIKMKFGAGSDENGDSVADAQPYAFQWKEPSEEEWNAAESFIEHFIDKAEKLSFDGGTHGQIMASRDVLFRVLRMLHAVQRGGRWVLAGAMPGYFAALDKLVDPNIEMTKTQAELALKRPLAVGLGGERGPEARALATALWTRVYQLASDIITWVLDTRPDDGALLYRCVEPLEIAHEPFRRTHQSRSPMQTCSSYKGLYRPIVNMKRPFGQTVGSGRMMPRFIVKLRVEAHHDLRLSIAVRGGCCADELNDQLVSQLTIVSMNDFPRVRTEARGVLTRALRYATPETRRREIGIVADSLAQASSQIPGFLNLSTSSTNSKDNGMRGEEAVEDSAHSGVAKKSTSPEEPDYEKMIGAANVLRSSAVAPAVMREWGVFATVVMVILRAMLSAERADASAIMSMLFGRLAALVRPLSIEPIRLMKEDYSGPQEIPLSKFELAERNRRLEEYHTLYDDLLGLVNRSMEQTDRDAEESTGSSGMQDSESTEKKEAHWRVQSLSATILYITMREDRPPPAAVADFFIRGVVSDVVSLRQVCSKATMLMLAVHGRREGDKLEDNDAIFGGSPVAWESLGNLALSTVGSAVESQDFARKMVHTLALDHDNSDGNSDAYSRQNAIGNAGGPIAVMNLSRHVDGDACWMLVGGKPWPSSWVPRSRDQLNIVRMRLYESFVRVYGMSAVNVFLPTLCELVEKIAAKEEKIISGVNDEDIRVLAGELVASICRGLDSVRCTDGDTEEKLMTVATLLLGEMSGRVGNFTGGTVIRLIATSEPYAVGCRVWKGIGDWLLKTKPIVVPMGDGPVAHLQARRLRYLHSCMADVTKPRQDHLVHFVRETLSDLTGKVAFDHELKTVREEVARCLALITCSLPPACENLFEREMSTLRDRLEAVPETPATDSDSIMNDGEESADTLARKSRSRQGETFSRFISIVHWGGRSKGFEKYVPMLVPCMFATFDESDPERISYARMSLSFSAQGNYSEDIIEQILADVETVSTDTRWKVRSAVLAFLQVFSFTSLFKASSDCLARIRHVVFTLLADSQLEVRQAAASVFVTMIRDSSTEAVDKVRQAFLEILKKTTPRRHGTKREPMSSEDIRKRHGAVLGLSSMITSSPYSVPPWMPSVLVALSRCVNDPPPISTTTRKTFNDFMRTHRDEWAAHKLAFTLDELEVVSELLISPSYYA